jgi:hypothetical protein
MEGDMAAPTDVNNDNKFQHVMKISLIEDLLIFFGLVYGV